jgi:hypothetical protein
MSDFDVGFVIFPGITQLDFTGPFEVLSRLSTPPSVSPEQISAVENPRCCQDARTGVQ